MIFNTELAKSLQSYSWSGNHEEHEIEEKELNRILTIMRRVSESYSCSHAEGFTHCEEELEKFLILFYEAGVKAGEESAKRQIIWQLQKSM